MRGNKKTRGAISVFLVIILVPCMVVTSLFVDLGRVHMSKTLSASASDLALNSLMTNYDADLNDWYGMVASCQNIEEFYEASAQFFLRTISSQGLSDEEIVSVSDYYSAATGDDTIYDLLKVESQTAASDMVSEVKDANLSNPTLLKDQIVEFMKYRAPIEITTGIIGKFTNEDGTTSEATSALIKSEENEPLVQAKRDFYAAEGELLTASYYSYWAIRDYMDAAKDISLNNAKLTEYQTQINGYKQVYEKINEYIVKNLYNTNGLNVYTRPTKELSAYSYEASDICSSTKKDEKSVTHYYINGKTVENLLTDLGNKITSFQGKITEFENEANTLSGTTTGNTDSSANPIQWWVQMDSIAKSNDISDAADKMLQAYAKVKAIDSCECEDDVAADWGTRAGNLKSQAENLQSTYLTSNGNGVSNGYNNAVSRLESISAANANNISAANLYVTIDGANVSVLDAPGKIASALNGIRDSLKERVDELDIAINGDGDDIVSLDTLVTLAQTYETEFNEWKNKANQMASADSSNSMAQTDKEETDLKELEGHISEESVSELKTRLSNIKSQLETVISAIDSACYGKKKLTEITTLEVAKTQAGTKIDTIPLMNGALTEKAKMVYESLFSPLNTDILSLSNTTGNTHNPDINPDNAVDSPELYKYFHNMWNKKDRNKFKEVEEDEEDTQSEVEDYEKEALGKASEYRGGGTAITKDFSLGNGCSIGAVSFIKSVVGLIENLLNGEFDSIRDDIYVTTYAMNMFSYATYDYEAQYGLLSDADKGKVTPSNLSMYDGVIGAKDQPGTWLSEDVKDSYNKTLTNKMINKDNNQAYLAEIEYIIYGKETNEENLKKAFGDIYEFRYALNLISGFQNFWSGKDGTAQAIKWVAGGISELTGGVIPPAVIKAVLIPILAAIETCQDNRRLASGMPVEIYKMDAEDWWISLPSEFQTDKYGTFFSELKSSADGSKDGKNQDSGLFYSDYMTLFFYLGLTESTETEADMYRRMAEVIQSNMRMHDGIKDYSKSGEDGNSTPYTLKNARVYFKLEATMRTDPLMLALPMFNDYDNNMDTKTDWCTYKVSTVRGYS